MIRRDPAAAAAGQFDLAIVGGGIYGVTLALEAARRGVRSVLVERDDFGGATSWNSLRIVHGGLRYLQTLDLPRFRESVVERRWWLAHFPDLVRPLPCLMPLYGNGMRRPAVLRIALAMNDILSARRNVGVDAHCTLPRGRVLNPAQTAAHFPGVETQGLRGAALWHDAAMPDSQRLIVELLHWAGSAGAVALNYTEAGGIVAAGGTVRGLAVRDRLTDEEHLLAAPVVINCAGPWCRELAAMFHRDFPELFRLSLAFNVLLDRTPPADTALGVEPREPGARTYFLHPWKGKVLAGTFHAPWEGPRADDAVEEGHVAEFLGDLNQAIPGFDLRPADVLRVHWGYLPAAAEGSAALAAREVLVDHGSTGGPRGLFSVSGVKFTTARRVAERTLRTVFPAARPAARSPTCRPAPATPASLAQFEDWLSREPERAAQEVRRLVETEAVIHIDDLVLRRTDWGMDPREGRRIATGIAPLLGWDDDRLRSGLARLAGAER